MTKSLRYIASVLLVCATAALPAVAQKKIATDIVVVGSGGAGLAAAVEALESGAKVVLLEKAPMLGGNSQFVEGMAAIDSEMMRQDNVLFTADMAYQRIMEYGHWKNNAALVRGFTLESGKNIEWLQAHGTKFERVATAIPGNTYRVWHLFEKHQGAAMTVPFTSIVKEFEKKGKAVILLGFGGQELVMKNGKVAAVIAKTPQGETAEIECKAVIIATGGFINNKEWMEKYTDAKAYSIIGLPTQTGDGIRMGMSAGAALEGIATLQPAGPIVYFTNGMELMQHNDAGGASREPFLWVGPNGNRFTDESCNLNWVYGSNAAIRMQDFTYHVFDDSIRKNWMEGTGLQYNFSAVIPTGTKLRKLDEDLKYFESKGSVFKANTLEELAKKTGMDPATLKQTVQRYNKAAAEKHDVEFGKDAKWLHPLTTPPYYAFKNAPYMLGTIGGLRVDSRLRVVTLRDKPIPGLYAAGRDAGGFYGDSYDYIVEGSTMGFAVFSGRVAAQDATAFVKQ